MKNLSRSFRLIANEPIAFSFVISECLKWANEAYFCVAYARYSAFKILEKDIRNYLRKGGKLRTIFDVERIMTEPEIIEELSTIPGDSECRVFSKKQSDSTNKTLNISGLFHPKLYLFRNGEKIRVLTGSSNFTYGGIQENIEANILINGTIQDKFWQEAFKYFEYYWNSPYAVSSQEGDFFEQYKKMWSLHHMLRRKFEKSLIKVKKIVQDIVEETQLELKSELNSPIAYLLGIIAGGGFLRYIARRRVIVKYHRRPMNPGSKDEGIICAPGISSIRIKQTEAIKRDVETINERLKNLFERAEPENTARIIKKSDYDYNILIQFSKDSKFWRTVYKFIKSSVTRGKRLIPKMPVEISNLKRKHLSISFLRGYADIRCRISMKDREGLTGPLRLSISVSTGARKFVVELAKLIKDALGIKKVGILEGGRRRRETMLRFDPVELPKGFFSLHWKKLLLEDFSKYNLEHYPRRYRKSN